MEKKRVAIIGSGNWGSAIARIVGNNVRKRSDIFEDKVPMWVFEEQVNGKPLTNIINERHENVKYLPGVTLPSNVVADSNLQSVVKGADALIFVLPHQFIAQLCKQLEGKIPSGVSGISLIKGVDVQKDRISIFADVIQETLGVSTSALSGANIADEVARDRFCETTIGYRTLEEGRMWQTLFQTPTFRIQLIDDVIGVSLCGALKNIIAISAGLVDGLGWGNNSKAAVIRLGLQDMKNFSMEFFPSVKEQTFLSESAGVADVITSCFGGRNRKCAAAFVETGKPFEQLEKELLGGQKLQGTLTAIEIHDFLRARGREGAYPLFLAVYNIAQAKIPAQELTAKL